MIETIDDNTLGFGSSPIDYISVGGFDWNLIFNWHSAPRRDMESRKHKTDPVRTPTMAGKIKILQHFEILKIKLLIFSKFVLTLRF